ncbi:hypothetical protein N9023_07390 [Opitutaceae bacterium]|nr:hypothetical protein [Opitutaceae bacterium]
MTSEIQRLLLMIVLPALVLMLGLWWGIRRKNTPPEMRWPRRNRSRGRRRSERDVPPAER